MGHGAREGEKEAKSKGERRGREIRRERKRERRRERLRGRGGGGERSRQFSCVLTGRLVFLELALAGVARGSGKTGEATRSVGQPLP